MQTPKPQQQQQQQKHSEPAYTFPGYFPAGGESRIFPAFYDRFGRGAKPWTLPHPDEIRQKVREVKQKKKELVNNDGGVVVHDVSVAAAAAATSLIDSRSRSSRWENGDGGRGRGEGCLSNIFTSTDKSIVVKWGPDVRISEAIALLTVDAYIGRACPVPTVYGWFVESSPISSLHGSSSSTPRSSRTSDCEGVDHGNEEETDPFDTQSTFIYMSYIPGPSLAERISTLTASEKGYIARQLKKAIGALGSLRPADGVPAVVGTLDGHGVGDRLLRSAEWADGVSINAEERANYLFQGVRPFHDFLAGESKQRAGSDLKEQREWERKRRELRDDQPIGFCHAGFEMRNVILTDQGEGPVRVKALLGWEAAGFYPVGWEGWKARLRGGWEKAMFDEVFGGMDDRLNGVWNSYDFFLDVAKRRRKATRSPETS